MKKINIEFNNQVIITFPTSNEEIKAACTPVDDDTMKMDIVELIIFEGRRDVSKEAKKEIYYPYMKARNRITKIMPRQFTPDIHCL